MSSSALSRFMDASITSKSPPQPCSRSLTFKNKNLASHGFHGSIIPKSLQYNPTPRNLFVCSNLTPPGAPLPPGSPPGSGSLRNWVLGFVLTLMLPLITRKGTWILLKNKVDTVTETIDDVMEHIEKVAKKADEIIDEITEDLPKNSKLKETLEAIDEKVEDVARNAHIANEIIDKVEEAEKKLESLACDEVKEKEVSIRVLHNEVTTQEHIVEK